MSTSQLPPINGTAFTIASAKPLCFKAVRGIVRCCLRKANVVGAIACFATDDIGENRSWHVGLYNVSLGEDEKRILEEGMEHFRSKLKLGSEVFFKMGINDPSRYLRGHGEVVEMVKIC